MLSRFYRTHPSVAFNGIYPPFVEALVGGARGFLRVIYIERERKREFICVIYIETRGMENKGDRDEAKDTYMYKLGEN